MGLGDGTGVGMLGQALLQLGAQLDGLLDLGLAQVLGNSVGQQHLLDAVILCVFAQIQRFLIGDVAADQINLGVVGNDLHDVGELLGGLAVSGDLDAAVILLGLELGIQVDQTDPLAVHIAAFHAGLILGGVSAERHIAGAVAVVHGRLDRTGIHAAQHSVQDDTAVSGEAGNDLVHDPSGTNAPVEHAHINDGAHTGVAGLDSGLNGVHAAGAGHQMGAGVHMQVNGVLQQINAALIRTGVLPVILVEVGRKCVGVVEVIHERSPFSDFRKVCFLTRPSFPTANADGI